MISRFLEWLFSWLLPLRTSQHADWEKDADWGRLDQEPLRARALLYWGGLVVIGLLVWSGFAQLDEVTRGEGRVIPSRQVQVIQAVDGGVVSDILTREGAIVEPGELLIRIDPTRFISSLRENRGQYLALQAKAERLKALSEERPFVPPTELAKEVPDILQREQILYRSSQDELNAQIGMAKQQLQQRRRELKEARANRKQLGHRYELAEKELNLTRPLFKSGAVSEVELLRLQRDVAGLLGQREQVDAQVEQIQAAIAEAEGKIREVELTFDNRVRRELSETLAKLRSLTDSKAALADRVKHAEVLSPVRGTVKQLFFNTVGGFVTPGKELAEIVPLDDALVLEVKIRPKDIAFLRPGQKAQVKFTAYDFAIYGGLDAEVARVGADTVIDERGEAFYLVRVRTLKASLGEGLPIIPGMMAQVDIMTGKKSLLAYLLKPILRAKQNALRER